MSQDQPADRGDDSTRPTGTPGSPPPAPGEASPNDPFLSVFGGGSVDRTVVASALELPVKVTRPFEELTRDKLIRDAPRARVQSNVVPCLGGIPLLAKLGQGGMGAVYYGIQPRLGQEVAVKVLPFHLADQNPEMIQRFYREARIAVGIQSPNLVRILDVNEENGLVFMVMEYVNGSSAGAYMKTLRSEKRALKERSALELCLAATRGLAVAHGRGVVHRDIKPDNILIPWDLERGRPRLREAKLADLGLARSVEAHGESLTASAAALGTPGYMSPEQGMDAKKASRPADIFSLGATLYALLCGHAPFRATSVVLTLLDTAQRPHVPVRQFRQDVSEATDVIINRCLAKDPAARFQDAGALLIELEKCCNALPESDELTVAMDLPDSAPVPASGTQSVPGSHVGPLPGATPTGLPSHVKPARRGAGLLICMGVVALVAVVGWLVFSPKPPEPVREPVRIAVQPETPVEKTRSTGPAQAPEPDPRELAVEQAKQQLTLSFPIALNHRLDGEWQQVVETLRPVMAALGDADHPSKKSAAQLLEEAERRLQTEMEYGRRLEELERHLAAGDWVAAETALASIGEKYPAHAGERKLKEAAARIEARRQAEAFSEAVQRGKDLAAEKQWEQAVAAYGKALESRPDDASTRQLLETARYQLLLAKAQAHLGQEDWLEAEGAFEKLATHPSGKGDEAVAKGLAQARRGRALAGIQGLLAKQDFAAGLLEAERFLQDHPGDTEMASLRDRARAALSLSAAIAARDRADWVTAETEFGKVLKLDPENAGAQAGLTEVRALRTGRTALQESRFDEAEKAYREALAARADSKAAADGLAEVTRKRAERDASIQAALATYEKVMAEGRQALGAGNWVGAEQAFRRALGIRPLDVDAQNGIKQAEAGRAAEAQYRTTVMTAEKALRDGDLAAAEQQFKAAQRLRPNAAEVLAGLRRVQEEIQRRQQEATKKDEPERPTRPRRKTEDDSVY